MCHIVGAPPFLVAFPRKATPIISGLHKVAQPLGPGKAAIAARRLPCGRLNLVVLTFRCKVV